MAKSKNKTVFVCQSCGAQRPRWEGRCSECEAWNSLVEEIHMDESKARGWSVGNNEKGSPKIVSLDQCLEAQSLRRFDTGFSELNRVLGGGLVAGSFNLLGGSPGVGKSTLLMQMAGGLAKSNQRVLYISGEESTEQTGSRAQRLGVRTSKVQVASESNLNSIIDICRNQKPDVVIIDSIQSIFLPDLQAAPGSVSQVRECTGHLMSLAKSDGMAVILIGHVTKEGTIAGPKVLEHMVDCVMSFDGESSHLYRLLRCLKNRFGATHELGVFKMDSEGLREVTNPSELFLEERGESHIGSAIFASMEGSRPLLCEVQALTVSSPMPMPRRTTLGIELNRLNMLTAVLDRHLNTQLSHVDVFINVVGGLKLIEPSSDLAVAAAILSTDGRYEIDARTVFFGEIGLTGEVRAISFAEQRIKEADKLGFETFVLPFSNKKHMDNTNLSAKKKLIFIKTVRELSKIICSSNATQN